MNKRPRSYKLGRSVRTLVSSSDDKIRNIINQIRYIDKSLKTNNNYEKYI